MKCTRWVGLLHFVITCSFVCGLVVVMGSVEVDGRGRRDSCVGTVSRTGGSASPACRPRAAAAWSVLVPWSMCRGVVGSMYPFRELRPVHPCSTASRLQMTRDVTTYVMHTLFNLCRVNHPRQNQAAEYGIIPALQNVGLATATSRRLSVEPTKSHGCYFP